MINALSSFKDINTIIIKAGSCSEIVFNRCIETAKKRLNDLAPSKEKRYIRVFHESNDSYFKWKSGSYDDIIRRNSDIIDNAFVRDYYSDIPI
jgi:hypothetical protein